MPVTLLKLLTPTNLVRAIGALVAVAAAAYVYGLYSDVQDLEAKNLQLKADVVVATDAATKTKETLDQVVENTERIVASLDDLRASEVARAQQLADTLARIEASGPEDDGPVAPVLRDAIERMYSTEGMVPDD